MPVTTLIIPLPLRTMRSFRYFSRLISMRQPSLNSYRIRHKHRMRQLFRKYLLPPNSIDILFRVVINPSDLRSSHSSTVRTTRLPCNQRYLRVVRPAVGSTLFGIVGTLFRNFSLYLLYAASVRPACVRTTVGCVEAVLPSQGCRAQCGGDDKGPVPRHGAALSSSSRSPRFVVGMLLGRLSPCHTATRLYRTALRACVPYPLCW